MDLNTPIKTYLESDRQPRLKLPPGSCDTHVHVFGPASQFPYAAARNFTPVDAPKEKLFALHRRLGIERCVIVNSAVHGTDNRVLEDAIANGGGHYLGIALVDPAVEQTELQRLKHAGIRGIRFNFVQNINLSITPTDLVRFCQRLAELDMHLQVHFEKSLIHDLSPTFVSCAELVPVVLDHMGRIDARDGLEGEHFVALCRMLDKQNFHVKVSGIDRIDATPPYVDGKKIATELVKRYPEQCLWGLDWPHPNHTHIPDDVTLLEALAEIAPTPQALERLMVQNPQKLYRFDH